MSRPRRPAPFILAACSHGTMIVNHNDYAIVGGEWRPGLGQQILRAGCYDPEEVGSALSLLTLRREFFGAGVVAVDCGANIGVHTVEWARHMHDWGRVIAIEAQERLYYALAGNIAINNCFNATAICAAVGAAAGRLRVPQPDYNKPASYGSLELRQHPHNEDIGQPVDYRPEHCREVDVITVDGLALKRLDFLKIDVEGMELEVLDGAMHSIERCRPQMLIESIKTDKAALSAVLKRLGYASFEVGINLLAIHATDPSAARIKVK
jgi:FkbM family methyltransferase